MAFRKFKFVEEFIDPTTGQPYENTGSPKRVWTKYFGLKELHQIAKIYYKKKVTWEPTVTIDEKTGKTITGPEEKRVTYEEIMADKGGWIERVENLAQGGKCWVYGDAVVCENGYVCDDAQVSGAAEIGGHAKIGGKAKVYEEGSVTDGAYVFGNAKVHGGERIHYNEKHPETTMMAVMGLARVEGEVDGRAMVFENAKVGPNGQVLGKSVARGFAQVYGKVDGKSAVSGNAIVYGEVKGESSVSGDAIIMEEAVVSGESAVGDLATVYGRVAGESSVMGNCRVGEDGTVQDAASNGNSEIDGTITEAKVSGNSHVLEKASVGKDSLLDGNATVSASVGKECSVIDNGRVNGKMNQSRVSGNGKVGSKGNMSNKSEIKGNTTVTSVFSQSQAVGGSIIDSQTDKTKISGGAILKGSVRNSEVSGSPYVEGGSENGKVSGNAIAKCQVKGGSITDNVRVGTTVVGSGGSHYSGSASGNGLASMYTDGEVNVKASISDNAIAGCPDQSVYGNQVAIEKGKEGDDFVPGEAAVILKVQAE